MASYGKQVKLDCEELLSRFQKTESVRFETFSKIWREMKFSEIFYGGVSNSRKRAFTRLILDKACCFFLPPFSFQIRVGGLYLLYSLHGCQTAVPTQHIRLALKDWEHVQKFVKDARDAQHWDAVYILQQMLGRKAFHFTAMPTLLSFNNKRKPERSPLCEDFIERTSRPHELINPETLEELSNIHELYAKMKTAVTASSEQAVSSIDLIRKNLVPELHGTVMDFYKWQQSGDAADDHSEDDGGEGPSSQQESSKRADLLASIKSRAFGQASEAVRSRRHRQVQLDVAGDETGALQFSGRSRRQRKPSLKAKTNMNVKISGEIWKAATAMTNIRNLTTLDFSQNGIATTPKAVKEETKSTPESNVS